MAGGPLAERGSFHVNVFQISALDHGPSPDATLNVSVSCRPAVCSQFTSSYFFELFTYYLPRNLHRTAAIFATLIHRIRSMFNHTELHRSRAPSLHAVTLSRTVTFPHSIGWSKAHHNPTESVYLGVHTLRNTIKYLDESAEMWTHRLGFEDAHLSLKSKRRFWSCKMNGVKEGRVYDGSKTIMELADSPNAAKDIHDIYTKFCKELLPKTLELLDGTVSDATTNNSLSTGTAENPIDITCEAEETNCMCGAGIGIAYEGMCQECWVYFTVVAKSFEAKKQLAAPSPPVSIEQSQGVDVSLGKRKFDDGEEAPRSRKRVKEQDLVGFSGDGTVDPRMIMFSGV